jgi:hypothetical protein
VSIHNTGVSTVNNRKQYKNKHRGKDRGRNESQFNGTVRVTESSGKTPFADLWK